MEETACPLCDNRASDPVVESAGSACRVVRCRDCGLAYTNPRPTPHAIGQFYPDDYTPYQDRAGSRRRRDPFVTLLPPPPGGRLLDFGCGSGGLLRKLHRVGWHVTGMDTSPRMAHHVRALGLDAIAGTLPHAALAPTSFDAITMAESLEHVHDPLRVLRAAHRLLRPDGKLVVSVPNLASLAFRWFGADWFGLDVPRHLTHFEPHTLRAMLGRAGFRVERLAPLRHNSWLRHSARRSAGWRGLLRYRVSANLAGWYSAARRQANGILAVAVSDTRS
jgi:2-polyprenyl-3-methyl-5-hydroxy-6-metoxy-1,4-benzoquinol methylase